MNVPTGWRLVPEKPTGEMLAIIWCSDDRGAEELYADLLAAAPSPPADVFTAPGVSLLALSGSYHLGIEHATDWLCKRGFHGLAYELAKELEGEESNG